MHGCIEELGLVKKSVIATQSREKLFLHLVAGMERRIIMMLMIMMCPVEAWKNEKSIIFKKTSEVIITRSKWFRDGIIAVQTKKGGNSYSRKSPGCVIWYSV